MFRISNRQALQGLFAMSGCFAVSQNKEFDRKLMNIRSNLWQPENFKSKSNIFFPLKVAACSSISDELGLKKQIENLFKEIRGNFYSQKDVTRQIEVLGEITRNTEDPLIIECVLRNVNEFFSELRQRDLFCSLLARAIPAIKVDSKAFSEFEKVELLRLCSFFSLINDCINKSKDKMLILETKVNFANLPYKGRREELSNLFLDEKDQLTCLVESMQEKENRLVDKIVDLLGRELCFFLEKDLAVLEKLLMSSSEEGEFSLPANLSEENKSKLRSAFYPRGQRSDALAQKAVDFALSFRKEYIEDVLIRNSVKDLKRIAKAKALFQDQLTFAKEDVRIPYWYHATRGDKIFPLLQESQIKVMFKGPGVGFKGAWVSSRVEDRFFGSSVIGLTNKVEKIKEFHIGHLYKDFRWRGFLSDISLKEKDVFLLVSVAFDENKTIQKTKKIELDRFLKENNYLTRYKICSVRQMVFIQREVTAILGSPNLHIDFWGKDL